MESNNSASREEGDFEAVTLYNGPPVKTMREKNIVNDGALDGNGEASVPYAALAAAKLPVYTSSGVA